MDMIQHNNKTQNHKLFLLYLVILDTVSELELFVSTVGFIILRDNTVLKYISLKKAWLMADTARR